MSGYYGNTTSPAAGNPQQQQPGMMNNGSFYGQQQQAPSSGGSGGQPMQSSGSFSGQQPQVWQPQQQQPGMMQQQQPGMMMQQQQPMMQQQPYQQYNNQGMMMMQQQPYNMQQQQQPFWNPQMAATATMAMASMAGAGAQGNTDAMWQVGMSAGQSILANSTARFVPGLEMAMTNLRCYFAVDNRYVMRKMFKVLFPFAEKQWQRSTKDAQGSPMAPGAAPIQYDLPNVDENAPDLYIPTMALITYVLLCAVAYGTSGVFNPEVIPHVTTTCVITQTLEVLLIRLGFYFMHVPAISFMDLFSYTGYKYLGLCVNMLMGLMVGHFVGSFGIRGYYLSFFWTATAASFFMLKVMANNIPMTTSSSAAVGGPKREVMVLAFAVSQFVCMWFVSQTKYLGEVAVANE